MDGDKDEGNKVTGKDQKLTAPLLSKQEYKPDVVVVDIDKASGLTGSYRLPTIGMPQVTDDIEDGEVIGIVTLEDVFEELLQEEIVDETDEYVDVHKRIRVAAASSVARAPSSLRRLTSNKAASKLGQTATTPRKSDQDSTTPRLQGAAGEPLLGNKR